MSIRSFRYIHRREFRRIGAGSCPSRNDLHQSKGFPGLMAFQRRTSATNAELRSINNGKARRKRLRGYERRYGFSQEALMPAGNLTPIRQTFNHVVRAEHQPAGLQSQPGAVVADTAPSVRTQSDRSSQSKPSA